MAGEKVEVEQLSPEELVDYLVDKHGFLKSDVLAFSGEYSYVTSLY